MLNFDKVMLNPQPLPPRYLPGFSRVALNPQPLPPGAAIGIIVVC